MSGELRLTGRIRIDPPITWDELHDKPWAVDPSDYPDVQIAMSGAYIEPTHYESNGYELVSQIERIAQTFAVGPLGEIRRFTGFLHAIWGGGQEIFRIIIVNGKAVHVYLEMEWPHGARDEDKV